MNTAAAKRSFRWGSVTATFFLGSADSKVVEIGGLEIYEKWGLLRSLVIETAFRGKGYGQAFTRDLIEYAKLKGVREIYLLTTTAVTFFTKIGFEIVERSTVPLMIKSTSQFTSLCPASAVCLRKAMPE
ncbi:MAG: N-acetylglutamate synthase [Cyanobacteria bacterium SW_12_48_29]|jgi:amino-acid N-acetyltransferase|nr:MAG: N-acetylglutamate synthase [Cyanobacteria bacterium QH_2_48_84]PSO73068.1 MAG: N-acetylglutamate synthase [Cyanobacteria bacterium QH_3_48_40]PSO86608.1 MAG: N-acetylglutamate synthase [Cyanobacteria bacterium QS_3_48_167]PSO97582.1 MAG: N-acetylglutamate synthase [Cyanobacteria bacterium SW_12_48_29]PSP23642.1 MAG: N-acetylglutamate synthase [Cyanobacteria bacterium SW_8_48_13]